MAFLVVLTSYISISWTPVMAHTLAIMMATMFLIPIFKYFRRNISEETKKVSMFQLGIIFLGFSGVFIVIKSSQDYSLIAETH